LPLIVGLDNATTAYEQASAKLLEKVDVPDESISNQIKGLWN
jgi:hypothetical protein